MPEWDGDPDLWFMDYRNADGSVGTVHYLANGHKGFPKERLGVFCAGLVLTALCSAIYHWEPDNAGLGLDRLGMAVAFAGLLGLAAAMVGNFFILRPGSAGRRA